MIMIGQDFFKNWQLRLHALCRVEGSSLFGMKVSGEGKEIGLEISGVQRKCSVNWESEGRSPRPGQFSLLISNIVALMNRGLE